jgi:hypothetical protein
MWRDDRCMVVDDERFKVAVVSYVIASRGNWENSPPEQLKSFGSGICYPLGNF